MHDRRRAAVYSACVALDIAPGELSDVFRREAARLLRAYADEIDHDRDHDVDQVLARVAQFIERADELELVWDDMNPPERESGGAVNTGATEATPLRPVTTTAAREDS
jgi:hypothetical protein